MGWDISHDDLALIRYIDQELVWDRIVIIWTITLAIGVNPRVAVRNHEVLLNVDLDFFDLLLEDNHGGTSHNGDTARLISHVLVHAGLSHRLHIENSLAEEFLNGRDALSEVLGDKSGLRREEEVGVVAPESVFFDKVLGFFATF